MACTRTLEARQPAFNAKPVADAKKTPPGNKNIFESSTARLDALGKYVCRKVKVCLKDGMVMIDVGESGMDEIKDLSVILPATIGQITSGKIAVEPEFLKNVVEAVKMRK